MAKQKIYDILEYINQHSEYVKVDVSKIGAFVRKNKNWQYRYWLEDLKNFLDEEQCIIFAFLCESINFCFWGNEKYNGEYIGSETIFKKMKKASLDEPQILNSKYLTDIDEHQFNGFFGDSYQQIPLMRKRYDLFKDTISIIAEKDDLFWKDIFSFQEDSELLDYITENFPAFVDKSNYKGKEINFSKKANLLVNDLFWLSDKVKNNLKDLDNLTGCADYAIPRLLLENDILIYNDELLERIKMKKSIPHNSLMEIEIRANTLYVIEIMKNLLLKQGIAINSVQLDNLIWRMRHNTKHIIPVHRTRTTCY